jgi:hypothetical protein
LLSRLNSCVQHEADLTKEDQAWCRLQRAIILSLMGRYPEATADLESAQKI